MYLKGNVGVGTSVPGVAGLQVGAGSQTVSPTPALDVTSALIKGNLEVDGKIYGDGSGLTNLSASSQWSGYLLQFGERRYRVFVAAAEAGC